VVAIAEVVAAIDTAAIDTAAIAAIAPSCGL
jgi:hypothetical protein